jgi:redox-regulated HSP33 family molecular chaperone
VSLVAVLPVAVVLLGAALAAVALGRLLDEAQQLRAELERAGRLRPAVVEVRNGALRLAQRVERLHRR